MDWEKEEVSVIVVMTDRNGRTKRKSVPHRRHEGRVALYGNLLLDLRFEKFQIILSGELV